MSHYSDAYVISGGKQLSGSVTISGAKNVALKTVIAALLFENEVEIRNIPRIRDINELLHLLSLLGAKAQFVSENSIRIDPRELSSFEVDLFHGSKIRTSFLLFAPLLYKFGKAKIPNPGGCRIGARPIDRIVNGMKELGVSVQYDHETGYYNANLSGKPKGKYTFEKPSHTGTEFMIMLSIFCEGMTIIENAAQEPEIDDLITFLNESGAQIARKNNSIIVTGVSALRQKKPYTIVGDRNEAVTYAVLAMATQGEVHIKGIQHSLLDTFKTYVKQIGAYYEEKGDMGIRFFTSNVLSASQIQTGPHPEFMTDWQPNWAVLMTQAQGISSIRERVFENRFSYVTELQKLGAHIEFVPLQLDDPRSYYLFNYEEGKVYNQAISIFGPKKLHNGVLSISDLRAGATLAIAALLANGDSVLTGVSILERGYERFIEKITALGGTIRKA